jgi:uncharacterized protein (TIRG00374 family)
MTEDEGVHHVVAEPPAKRKSRFLRLASGYLIAVLCLIYVFLDVRFERILSQLQAISWGWIVLAVIMDSMVYVLEGAQWRELLKPCCSVSLLRSTQAIYAGLFANEVLPLRAGELVRGFLISQWTRKSFFDILPSIMVQRFIDGIWLAIGVGLMAVVVQLPNNLLKAADILGIVILSMTVLFVFLVFRREKKLSGPEEDRRQLWKPMAVAEHAIRRLARGIKVIGMTSVFFSAFAIAFFVLSFQVLSFWLVMKAYGLHFSIWIGAFVQFIVLLGTAIPNAPANVGTYQLFTVVGLSLFGVDKTTATGFSIVVFSVLSAPFWIFGFIAVSRSGIAFRRIKSEISELVKRVANGRIETIKDGTKS